MHTLLPAALLLYSLVCPHADAEEPAPAGGLKLIISKETTYFTEPVREDGTVDYIAALNKIYSEGVTPENNAAVLLLPLMPIAEDLADPDVRWVWHRAADRIEAERPTDKTILVWPQRGSDAIRQLGGIGSQTIEGMGWSAEDQPLAVVWVERQVDELQRVEQATRRPEFFLPLVSDGESGMTVHLWNDSFRYMYPLALLMRARGMFALADGDFRLAFESWSTMRRLSHHFRGDPTLLGIRAAGIVQSTSGTLLRHLLAYPDLDAPRTRSIVRELERTLDREELQERIALGERVMLLDALQDIRFGPRVSDDPLGDFGERELKDLVDDIRSPNFDISVATRIVNEHYDKIAAVPTVRSLKDLDRRDAIFQALKAPEGENPRLAFTHRITTRVMGDFLDHAERQWRIEVLRLMQDELSVVAAGLEAYRLESGRYPDSLDALTKGDDPILEVLPVDRYDGRPLTYKTNIDGKGDGQTYLLYSVGRDGKDNGGVAGSEDHEDDIAIGRPDPPTNYSWDKD